jgi:hypothetical protein
MAKPDVDEPRIRFKIAGIIAICVRETKKAFDVGVVKSTEYTDGVIPGHEFSMVIEKEGAPNPIVSYNSATIPEELSLKVNGQPTSAGIEFFTPGIFKRSRRHSNNHFRWALDVGNGELHSGPVDIKSAALRSVLRVSGIESAIFYTDNLSKKPLKIKVNSMPQDLGVIAGEIEALIPLSQGGADFNDGIQPTRHLDPESGVTYNITIEQVCSTVNKCSMADAEKVYRELFRTNNGREIDIIGMDHRHTKKVNPEIGCVGVNFSGNDRLPPAG